MGKGVLKPCIQIQLVLLRSSEWCMKITEKNFRKNKFHGLIIFCRKNGSASPISCFKILGKVKYGKLYFLQIKDFGGDGG